jgi:hypothetical protein
MQTATRNRNCATKCTQTLSPSYNLKGCSTEIPKLENLSLKSIQKLLKEQAVWKIFDVFCNQQKDLNVFPKIEIKIIFFAFILKNFNL